MKIHGTIQRDPECRTWFDFKTTQGNDILKRNTNMTTEVCNQFERLRLNGAHFTIQDTPTSHTTKLEILDVDYRPFYGTAVKVRFLGKRMSFCRAVWGALNLPLTTGTFYVRIYRAKVV